ncbi:MAG: sulfatase-like hydrolase/transferase [Desulfocapsaceae bacterium]|nr:sulfatase-like hydrolase/transferase [Desulfocapsaceae bacterium]
MGFQTIGGIDDFIIAFRFELPYLFLLFAALLYCMRPGPWRVVIAVIPFMLLYAGMDLFYIFMQSVFKLDDISLLPEGLNVSPLWMKILGTFFALGWIGGFLLLLKRQPRQFLIPLLLLILAACPPLAAYKAPRHFLRGAEILGIHLLPWSDCSTSAVMGRTLSLFLFAADKRDALERLSIMPALSDPERDPALLSDALKEKRNIHILVLESFLDPQQFAKLQYRTPSAPARFEPLRKNMHIAQSPVFGGGTAQAEFEVLCGVPAYKLYSSAEFNMLNGTATPCLPGLLAGAGYRTIATQPFKPEFFNSDKAYRSLGFQETNFPTIYAGNRPTYLKYDIPESYIFDGDLFDQNLSYVQKLLADGQPFLNYVLGIYGHMPHATDTNRFPPMVDIVGVRKGSQTYLALQQFYYRAGALADYLKKLREMDPRGIILVTSDHLPPLDLGPRTYQTLGYRIVSPGGEYRQNIWIYDGPQGKNTEWPHHYYEYMDFLFDALTDGRFCKSVACKNRQIWSPEKLTSSYNSIISQGAGISVRPTDYVAGVPQQPALTDRDKQKK